MRVYTLMCNVNQAHIMMTSKTSHGRAFLRHFILITEFYRKPTNLYILWLGFSQNP